MLKPQSPPVKHLDIPEVRRWLYKNKITWGYIYANKYLGYVTVCDCLLKSGVKVYFGEYRNILTYYGKHVAFSQWKGRDELVVKELDEELINEH